MARIDVMRLPDSMRRDRAAEAYEPRGPVDGSGRRGLAQSARYTGRSAPRARSRGEFFDADLDPPRLDGRRLRRGKLGDPKQSDRGYARPAPPPACVS